MAFKDLVRKRVQKYLEIPDKKKSTETTLGATGLDGMGGIMNRLSKTYFDSLKGNIRRTARYDEFRYLDKNLAEGTATLNIYSDNIVSGAIGGEENYKVAIDKSVSDAVKNVIEQTEKRTGIKDDVWDIARDMICYGDDWEEVVVVEEEGEMHIEKLKRLPPKEMYADVDERGVWNNPEQPYIQKKFIADKGGIPFDRWRIIHFKTGRGIYGVDRSIFANASRRIGRQLLWIDDSVVLARLSRAYMRYAFFVDTSGLNLEDKFRFAEEFLERVRRKEIIDRSTGRISPVDAPFMPDEDIAIPVEKDSPQDIKTLSGDLNLGKIEDIRYLQEKFFMALNMPKAYASQEQGVRAKATMTQLDVQFARQVRRKQQSLKPGLRRFYEIAFYLADIDPDSFKWTITFPLMATMDEMLKWQMEETKAKIAKLYTTDMSLLNGLWVMEKLLGFNKEDIEKYSIISPEDLKKPFTPVSAETAAMIRRDPYLRAVLDNLKDLAAWKLQREKELEGKEEVGLEREEELEEKWQR